MCVGEDDTMSIEGGATNHVRISSVGRAMAKRYLVTGATGQLGAYLVRELAGRGHEVIAWSGSKTEPVHGVPVQPVDLRQPEMVTRAFAEARPTHVIHAAAMAFVGDCTREP